MLIVNTTEIEHFGHWQLQTYSRRGVKTYNLQYDPVDGPAEYKLLAQAASLDMIPNQWIRLYSLLLMAPSESVLLLGDGQVFVDFKKADSHREELFWRVPFSMKEAEELASFKQLELLFYDVRKDFAQDKPLSYCVSNTGYKDALSAFTALEQTDT